MKYLLAYGMLSPIQTFLILFPLWCLTVKTAAQDHEPARRPPLTISFFSESVSLPNFRNLFDRGGWGVRIGTEFYYKRRDNREVLQNLQLGYYHHGGLQQGLFLSTAFGYRKIAGAIDFDATIGAGYLHLISALPRYEPDGLGFRETSPRLHKLMPTLGLGIGYRFDAWRLFSRYELFGELPFGYGGTPLLPHKALHIGTQFAFAQ